MENKKNLTGNLRGKKKIKNHSSKTKKMLILSFFAVFVGLVLAKSALAVCPLCVVAVGAGIELSRWLGVDDVISGLWIGGLIVSFIIWTIDWLNKKKINFKGKNVIITSAWYLLTIIPLYVAGIIGNPARVVFNINGFNFDKLTMGILTGSVAFYYGFSIDALLRKKNNSRAYFPFQKVVLPVISLILISVLFYFLVK